MVNNVLLVDDDEGFRSELKECLEEYHVYEAKDGNTALKMLRTPNEIDLVVLDYTMPGMSGTEVLSRIKREWPDLPVVLLTGHGSKDLVVSALRMDAEDYLEKPIRPEDLIKKIDSILAQKQVESKTRQGMIDNVIERARSFIERNCFKKVTLESTASVIALSPKYLSRLFKEKTGVCFKQYVQQVKVEEAKKILMSTDMTVSQMAYKFAYENPESFIRLFKRVTGQNPSAFRKKVMARRKRQPAA